MKGLIKKLLRESLNEVDFAEHSLDRVKERFNKFTDEDVNPSIKQQVLANLDLLSQFNFPAGKSFGVLLGVIPQSQINTESRYYRNYLNDPAQKKFIGAGNKYYSINDDELMSESTGNEFWIVIRNNKATTFMLRKDAQTKDSEYNAEKLRVDNVIKNLRKHIETEIQKMSKVSVGRGKYQKVTLTNGNQVKYYPKTNEFETMDDQPIKVDDVFDDLPEELQNKVIELTEGK